LGRRKRRLSRTGGIQESATTLANAYNARVNRIRISYAEIDEIQWTAIFVLAALIILTTGPGL
jgi:hypothetical protein